MTEEPIERPTPGPQPDEMPPPRRREEPRIFTIWVHVGYTVLILSTIAWIVYLEYFLD